MTTKVESNAVNVALSITDIKQRNIKRVNQFQNFSKSSSAFQLTLNETDKFDMIRDYVKSFKAFCYGIAGKEKAPTTGHEHIHLYVQYHRSVRLSIPLLLGAHVEKCKGSPQANKAYVEKEGDIVWEEGTMKTKGGKSIAAVKSMEPKEREELPVQFYNIVRKIADEEALPVKVGEWHKEIKVFYIWGEPGIGKSKKAEELISNKGYKEFDLLKFDGSFWHGVSGKCEAAIYDDWRDHHMKPYELINFIDYNIHPMNVKGGTMKNKYKLIVITTIQDPSEIYSRVLDEQRNQWERRWKIIHIKKLKKNSN